LKKIERPNWRNYLFTVTGDSVEALNEWFDKYAEPNNKALDEGVEVWSCELPNNKFGWYTNEKKSHDFGSSMPKEYKGLLLNIAPIKKETREEKLSRLLYEFVNRESGLEMRRNWETDVIQALEDK